VFCYQQQIALGETGHGERRETMPETSSFVRARRPEQREVRRQAILDAAEAMLGEMPVDDISLRALSKRADLATSNVLRYFETREAVFLELLDQTWQTWLDGLETELPKAPAPYREVARAYAESLARRPLMCELISVLAGVLERNVSRESVITFKARALEHTTRTAHIVAAHIPELDEAAALELTSMVSNFVAGLWPVANPSPVVAEAINDPCLIRAKVNFTDRLSRTITVLIAGLLDERPAAK
jgi:AcrR family transcriptional regulator